MGGGGRLGDGAIWMCREMLWRWHCGGKRRWIAFAEGNGEGRALIRRAPQVPQRPQPPKRAERLPFADVELDVGSKVSAPFMNANRAKKPARRSSKGAKAVRRAIAKSNPTKDGGQARHY